MSSASNQPVSVRRRVLASAAAVAIVASGALGATVMDGRQPAFAQAAPIAVPSSAGAPASFADVVERVKPAVVSVKVSVQNASASDEDGEGAGPRGLENVPPQLREFFRRFGEGNGPAPRRGGRGMAVGSGFFVSADGFVVTNNHVVENGGRTVQVLLDDGRTLDAKVIGSDPKTDLALLKVNEPGTYPFVTFAPVAPRVGDWVVAIGNPFGLGGTVTSGIVSARGRDIGAGPYDDFLQIDAPINRGNSGGPTFNLKGEVVGVNTAIASPSGGSVGLAFAIPSATVQNVVGQLETAGEVTRGYLGVQIQPLTRDLADGLGLKRDRGALVNAAEGGTPAAKAGLKSGDVITAINGEPLADARELTRRIAGIKPGSTVELGYVRDGRERTASVELGILPGREARASDGRDDGPSTLRLGLQLAPAARTGAAEEGVAVVAVDPDGPAAAKGLAGGDVILEVAGKPVSSPADVAAGIKDARTAGRTAVLMRVKGRTGSRFVAIALPKAG